MAVMDVDVRVLYHDFVLLVPVEQHCSELLLLLLSLVLVLRPPVVVHVVVIVCYYLEYVHLYLHHHHSSNENEFVSDYPDVPIVHQTLSVVE
jgi:hypothetical protein